MTDSRPHRIHVALCSVFKVLPEAGAEGAREGAAMLCSFPRPYGRRWMRAARLRKVCRQHVQPFAPASVLRFPSKGGEAYD